MHNRILIALLGPALLVGCGEQEEPEAMRDVGLDTTSVAPAEGQMGEALFVDSVTGDAQLVFVHHDTAQPPADRPADAVAVPFSTFAVERDGIPNEFPSPDSMAALLEDAGVRGERVVIVGEPIPAGRAYAAFDYLGLGDRAALLDGGPDALVDRPATGDTTATGARTPRPDETAADTAGSDTDADFAIDVREDMVVDAEWVNERLDDPSVAILDARPPAEFSGETAGPGVERAGHIPGARNVFWQTLVRSEEDTRLKDEAELRRIFEEAGVEPGDTVVTYCLTGGQGSFLYAVARHLGYDARLYDGSYIDWQQTDYPVEP